MSDIKKKKQKGTLLLMAILIMSILLAIGLGLGTILFQAMKIVRGIGDSVIAFYAADTGIEDILMRRQEVPLPIAETCFPPPNNDICYKVEVFSSGAPECPAAKAPNYCLRSVGSYRGVKRAIEITY